MASRDRYFNSSVTGGVSTPNNALGVPDSTFTTDTGNTNWTHEWDFSVEATGSYTGDHTVVIVVRKDSTGGGDPSVDAVVFDVNGTPVTPSSLTGTGSITSATSQNISATIANADLSPGDTLTVEIQTSGTGGAPANRRAVQVDGATWTADYNEPATPVDLVVQDGSHSHTADNVAITHSYDVTPQEASHGHTSESPTVTHSYDVVADDGTHNHTADNVTVSTGSAPVDITVQDGLHGHTADNATIEHSYNVSANDGLHTHIADNVDISHSYALSVEDGLNDHTAEEVLLGTFYAILVDDASHAHTADNVTVTVDAGEFTLVVQSGLHNHVADNVTIQSGSPLDKLILSGTLDRTIPLTGKTQVFTKLKSLNRTKTIEGSANKKITI